MRLRVRCYVPYSTWVRGDKRHLFEMTAPRDRWKGGFSTFDRQRCDRGAVIYAITSGYMYVGGIVIMDAGGSYG